MDEDRKTPGANTERNAQYLNILRSLSTCSESYMYLMDFRMEKVWLFGRFDEEFDLGEAQADDSYLFSQLLNAIHPTDRPSMIADMEQLIQGTKKRHDLKYRVLDRNGSYVWLHCHGEVETDSEGRPSTLMGCISEIASHYLLDSLTGLYNQEQLLRDMKQALAEKSEGFLVFLGINNMKNINTMYGRLEGDRILQDMAMHLETLESDFPIYRMFGDVFAILMFGTDERGVQDFFHRLQARVSEQFTISGGAVQMGVLDVDVNKQIQYCEFAMRKAKNAGKNTLTIFDMSVYQSEVLSVSLLNEMTENVKKGCKGFFLVYQAQMLTENCKLSGAEALLRFKSHTRGNVFPDEFIPLLERSELIYPVGLWVLETALAQCRVWRQYAPDFRVSVNMSYMQLSRPEIVQDVLDALDRSGLPGDALTIEVTESMQLQEYRHYNTIFDAWQKRGISISVDDFGTGFSSLSYLKFLKVDEIKVDRCFVNGIHSNRYNYMLLKNIVQLSDSVQIRICCEGVEDPEDYYMLDRLQVTMLQGYLFSKPCESAAFERQFFQTDAPENQQYLSRLPKPKRTAVAELMDLQHREVLRSVGIGLWLLRLSDDLSDAELYIDETMREQFGTPEGLSPSELYQHWFERIGPKDQSRVGALLRHILKTGEVARVQYTWSHPTRGRLRVGGDGIRLGSSDEGRLLQGCHWIADDLLDYTGQNSRLSELEARCMALQEKNRELEEKTLIYQTALSLTDHVVTYIDIPKRTLHHLYHESSYEGVGGVMENVPDSVLASGIIPPEDQEVFRRFYGDVYSGKPKGESGLFRTTEGDRRGFVRMIFKTIFDENGAPAKAVVFSDDVTKLVIAEHRYDEYRKAVVSGADFFWEANLSQDAIIQEADDFDSELLGRKGFRRYTDIISAAIKMVVPEYRELVESRFSIDSMIQAYSCGKREFSMEYPLRNVRRDLIWLRTTVYLLTNAQSELCVLICANNISEDRAEGLLAVEQARFDPLTHLLNRRGLVKAVEQSLAEQGSGWEGVFLLADVDDFKKINDRWGHPSGDYVLQTIARILQRSFRGGDLVSRLGGDEFAILIDERLESGLLERRISDMQGLFGGIVLPNGGSLDVHLSIGGTRVRPGDKFEDMYSRADSCMYDVKRNGKNGFRIA